MPVPSDLTAPAHSGAIVPEIEEDVLEIAPNYPFYLVHYGDDSGNWFVGEIKAGPGVPEEEVGLWWLPKLQSEPAKPGLNLHRTRSRDQKPEAVYRDAHRAIESDGGVVLPKSLGYCVPYRCRHPVTGAEGTYYSDPWSTPKPKLRGKAQKFTFDRNRYHRWLLRLMVDGHIEPPVEDVVKDIRNRREARIARREAQTDLPEDKREKLVLEATEQAIRVSEAQIPAAEQPAPKRVTRRKPKPSEEG